MTVYKYVHQSRIDDILESGQVRFTQPDVLNDPFETLPDISIIKAFASSAAINEQKRTQPILTMDEMRRIKAESDATFRDYFADHRREASSLFLFLSLAKRKDNLLMWSHYADMHHGFVIGFDETSPFLAPGHGRVEPGLREVEYTAKRYQIRANFASLSVEQKQTAMFGILFTKSPEWDYEEELRIVAYPASASSTSTLLNGEECYLFDFTPDSLQEVILGLEMSDGDKTAVTEIVRRKYPHAALFQAELHESQFALNIVPVA